MLWIALRGVRVEDLLAIVAGTSWPWLAGVLLLVFVDRGLMAWRWIALVRAAEPDSRLSSTALARTFFVSTFAGTLLPGSIGGDAVRAVSASRLGLTTATVVGSVAVDRMLGTLSVLLMAAIGLAIALAARLLDGWLLAWVAALAAAGAGATMLLLFSTARLTRIVQWLGRNRWPTVERLTIKTLAAFGQYDRHHGVLARVFALSFVVQVLRTLQAWGLGVALGLDVSAVWYFALIPIIVVVLLLPISIAGLGSGNLAFERLFSLALVAAPEANALAFLFIALGPIGSLPGGLWLFLTRPLTVRRD